MFTSFWVGLYNFLKFFQRTYFIEQTSFALMVKRNLTIEGY
jgi:ABC-type polysaccharide transport system permease subunit